MFRRTALGLVALWALRLLVPAQAETLHAPQTISIPGYIVVPNAINNTRKIVGAAVRANHFSYSFHGHQGDFHVFSPVPGMQSVAYGVNNNNMIVGSYFDLAGNGHGFTKYESSIITFDILPEAVSTLARTINLKGDIAGSYVTSDGRPHGFTKISGVVNTIDMGQFDTWVTCLNDAGDFAGYYYDSTLNMAISFISINGKLSQIPHSPSQNIEAFGLNNYDQVVGQTYPAIGGASGFFFDGTTLTELVYKEIGQTSVYGINDHRHIVGFTDNPPNTAWLIYLALPTASDAGTLTIGGSGSK